jgi:hypothetical protein
MPGLDAFGVQSGFRGFPYGMKDLRDYGKQRVKIASAFHSGSDGLPIIGDGIVRL